VWVWFVAGGAVLLLVGIGVGAFLLFGTNKLTAENFAKIKKGMSESEVRDTLGSPSETYNSGQTVREKNDWGGNRFNGASFEVPPGWKVLYWKKSGHEAVVVLVDGKVAFWGAKWSGGKTETHL
jgi:hypothetical protein